MNKSHLIHYVQSVLPIPIGKAEQIVENFQPGKFARNDFLLREGTICNESHFIEQGFMRSFTHDPDGNEVTTGFFSENMYASDPLSFFKRTRSKESIQALTDCETWYTTYDDMQADFHNILEYREYGRLNLINQYSLLKQRMLSLVQETAEQRYSDLIRSHPEILQYAPLKSIASYLGITDTSLSRIRKDFIKK